MSKNKKFAPVVAAALIAALLSPSVAGAQSDENWQDWTLGKPWVISLEAFHPNINTQVRLDSTSGVPGTPIDLERDLAMDDTAWLPQLNIQWRFAKKHRFITGYYELNRSSDSTNPIDITIGETTFPATFPIASAFKTSVVHLLYSYSLSFNEKAEFALTTGLSFAQLRWGYGTDIAGIPLVEQDKFLAPVPTFAFGGGYAFTDKLFFRGRIGYLPMDFALDDEDDLKGDISVALLGIYHQTFEHVQFGFTLQYFKIDVEWGNGAGFDRVKHEYYGPSLGVSATF